MSDPRFKVGDDVAVKNLRGRGKVVAVLDMDAMNVSLGGHHPNTGWHYDVSYSADGYPGAPVNRWPESELAAAPAPA
jgi:hypothetical protein